MKKVTILLALLAVASSAQAAYTYTYGPGSAFGTTFLYGTQSVLVNGGGGDRLVFSDYSSATILTTTHQVFSPEGWWITGGIAGIDLYSHSTAAVSGGEIRAIAVNDNAHLVLSAGKIDQLFGQSTLPVPAIPEDKYIQVVCKSWNYNSGTKMLSGVWRDNATFSIQLVDTSPWPSGFTFDSINFTIVPEPLTLGLLAMGGLLARRLRRA
jgi:hypothetical protein